MTNKNFRLHLLTKKHFNNERENNLKYVMLDKNYTFAYNDYASVFIKTSVIFGDIVCDKLNNYTYGIHPKDYILLIPFMKKGKFDIKQTRMKANYENDRYGIFVKLHILDKEQNINEYKNAILKRKTKKNIKSTKISINASLLDKLQKAMGLNCVEIQPFKDNQYIVFSDKYPIDERVGFIAMHDND